MSIFQSVGHFFAHLFGANSKVAEQVLTEAAHLAQQAAPVVSEIETTLKPLAAVDASGKVSAIEDFLLKHGHEVTTVGDKAEQLALLPSADLWHKLAVLGLSFLAPGANTSALNLAVELAYNIFKAGK